MPKEQVPTVAAQSSASVISEEGDEALLTQDVDPAEGIEFADPTKDDGTVGDDVVSSDDKPAKAEAKPAAKPAVDDDGDLPEPLRGKSRADIARMYADAQRAIGRQGQELGELRNLADTHIRSTIAARAAQPATTKPAAAPLEDKDFFSDPTKAVKAAIDNALNTHPEVQRLRGANQQLQANAVKGAMEAAQTKFNSAHPDAGEVLGDPEFQAWVGASPVRKALLQRAHHKYDFAAGNEVFQNWKELKAARAPADNAGKEAAAAKAKATKSAGKVPTGGNAGPKQGTSGEKIYRRADLIRLQIQDHERYEMMSGEIERAYREGRVR